MPLVKATFKNDLKTALEDVLNGSKTSSEAAEALANAIVNATDAYIRTATVNVSVPATGITSPQGPCTGSATGTGGLS